jgi:hypothetical protein
VRQNSANKLCSRGSQIKLSIFKTVIVSISQSTLSSQIVAARPYCIIQTEQFLEMMTIVPSDFVSGRFFLKQHVISRDISRTISALGDFVRERAGLTIVPKLKLINTNCGFWPSSLLFSLVFA